MIKLRDYQTECVDAINALERGSALVSMATGLGKTVVFSHIKRHGRVLIISHRFIKLTRNKIAKSPFYVSYVKLYFRS